MLDLAIINKRARYHNAFIPQSARDTSNLRIVSMIPGDREVAGCFIFFYDFGGIC